MSQSLNSSSQEPSDHLSLQKPDHEVTKVNLTSLDSGVLVLVVTLVGCCGISRESHSLVLTYSFLLSLVFLAEVGAGVMAYLYR